jgi:hypothetical protein
MYGTHTLAFCNFVLMKIILLIFLDLDISFEKWLWNGIKKKFGQEMVSRQ